MINQQWVRSAALIALAFSLPASAAAETRYIVETTSSAGLNPVAAKYGLVVGKSWKTDEHTAFSVTTAAPLSAGAAQRLRAEPGVVEFEADSAVHSPESAPGSMNKPATEPLGEQLTHSQGVRYFNSLVRGSYVDQPATRIIGLAPALQRFGAGVSTVAIIDTGVDPKHPALASVLLPGYDFTRDAAGTASELADLTQSTVAILDQSTVAILDGKQIPVRLNQSTVAILDQSTVAILDAGGLPKAFGHGTMVAGLVHLVAPTARILPLKAFRADGSASLSDIVRAIYYAADHGAGVISMSFSLSAPSQELQDAINYAAGKGAICVASAGNDGREKAVYPAAYRKVLGVGSTNYSDHRSPFSNYGDFVRAAAPGEALVTTYPGNNYAGVWGTSFSTGLVSGAVALMQQIYPRIGYDKVRDALDKGVHIGQDMGDARLSLLPALLACSLFRY
jgi:subtilisin family serine protease